MNKKYVQTNLDKYIDILLNNQKQTNANELKNVFTRKDYYLLLRSVLEVIKENKYSDMTSLRLKLLDKSGLKEMLYHFVYDEQITPGIVLEYGTELSKDTLICGNKQEVILKNNKLLYSPIKMEYDTIFDLASTSKLFTSLAVYKCVELGLLNLDKPVTEYVKEFTNLKNITIYDLLTFAKPIKTEKRIDSTTNHFIAQNILLTAYPYEHPNLLNSYTDITAMILRIVVEQVTNLKFTDFIKEIIIKPLGLDNTFLNVPKNKLNKCANENYSIILKSDGTYETKINNYPGTIHDPKAISIGHNLGIAPGHAGYFSNTPDMMSIGSALLKEKIISYKYLLKISDTVVGKSMFDNNNNKIFTKYFGSLVYLKQPNPHYLSVYPPLSGKAFMSPGFTGTTFCIDPLNKITLFLGSNRLHNRVYQLPAEAKIKINSQNKKTIILPNNEEKIVSSTFSKDKQKIVKVAMDLSIQYQFLEILFPKEKELHLIREI